MSLSHPRTCALLIATAVSCALAAGDAMPAENQRNQAIDRGLAFLRARQAPDGGMGDGPRCGLTALAVLAHLADGVLPDHRDHGPLLRRSLGFILSQADANGYLGGRDGSRLYGHGAALQALAACAGTLGDVGLEERVRRALERGVAVTVAAARVPRPPAHAGGWRYLPEENRSDLSCTGWQLLALHAASQAGIPVPAEIPTQAVAYIRLMVAPDGKVGYESPETDHPALRGLALVALARDPADAKLVTAISGRLRTDPISWQGPWFFYRAYYDAIGVSRALPQVWRDGYGARLVRVLIEHQNQDGSWPAPPGDNEAGNTPVYSTSLAVMALAAEKRLLPAWER